MATGVFTVTFDLPRATAEVLATLLGEDPRFDGHTQDRHEIDPATDRVTVYFEGEPRPGDIAGLADLCAATGGTAEPAVARLPETDWVAASLAGLPPVRAGRFLVHGGHDRDRRIGGGEIALEIEAGQAFGTGHHGTTVGCLAAIDRILSRRAIGSAVDIGTGTGVLAIAIARLTHRTVVATDIDPVAVDVARENAWLNGAGPDIRFAVAAGTHDRVFRTHGPFDLIVANILAGPLAAMAHDIYRIAAPGADLVLSGLLPHQHRQIRAAYRNAGFHMAAERIVDGWLTLELKRPEAWS